MSAFVGEGLLWGVVGFGVLAFGSVEAWAKLALCSAALLFAGWSWHCGGWFPAPRRTKIVAATLATLSVLAALQALRWAPLPAPASLLSTVDRDATISAALFFAVLATFALGVSAVLREPARRERFRLLLVLLGVVIALSGIIERSNGNATFYGLRPMVTGNPFVPFQNPNHAAIVLVVCLFFAHSGLKDSWSRFGGVTAEALPRGFLWASAMGLMLWAVVEIRSRGALWGLGAGIAVLLAVNVRSRRAASVGAGVLAVGALALACWSLAHWGDSENYRITFIRKAAALFADRPFGYGFSSTAVVFAPSRPPDILGVVDHLHSDWAEFALEGGVVGIAVGATALVGVIFCGSSRDAFWLAGAAGAVSIAAHSMVDFPLQIPGIVLVFTLLLSIPAVSERSHGIGRSGRFPVVAFPIVGTVSALIVFSPLMHPLLRAFQGGGAASLFESDVWPFEARSDYAAASRDFETANATSGSGLGALRRVVRSDGRFLSAYPHLAAGNFLQASALSSLGRKQDSVWFRTRAQVSQYAHR